MSLFKSLFRISSLTLLSRIFGFVRDLVIANIFGASANADAFFVAFRIPNLFRRFFAEGAFSQAFVPLFIDTEQQLGKKEANQYANAVTTLLMLVLLVFCTLCMLAAPWVVLLFAPGFAQSESQLLLTTDLLRLTFPYLFFISLTAMLSGVLHAWSKFAAAAFAPVLLNLSLIAAVLMAAPWFERPIIALGWGVFMAGIIQFFWIWWFAARAGFRLRLAHWRMPRVYQTIKQMIPAMFGATVAQINLLIDSILASFLVAGSVSWLYYSDRLMEFPLGVFGVALGTLVLPTLSKHHTSDNPKQYNQTLNWALQLCCFLAIPSTVGLIMLSQPMLVSLFGYGAFNETDVYMSQLSLMAYALGLPAFMAIKIFAPAYYARHNIKTPVKIAAIAVLVNLMLSLLLIESIQHTGLALATAIAAWVNVGLLGLLLHRSQHWFSTTLLWKNALKILISACIMGYILWWVTPQPHVWSAYTGWGRISLLLGLLCIGTASFVICTQCLGLKIKSMFINPYQS